MALTIFFMLLFSALLVIFDHKNQYSFMFAGMASSISLSIITLIIEIQRISNYNYTSRVPYGQLDAWIFYEINRISQFPITTLMILRNVGIIIYFLMNLLFVRSFAKCIKNSSPVKHRRNGFFRILLILYGVVYFVFYSPQMGYYIYLTQFDAQRNISQGWVMFVTIVHILIRCCAYLCLCYPVIFLVYNHITGHFTLFFEQLISLLITICILNFMFIFFFFSDAPLLDIQNVLRTGFWRSLNGAIVPKYYASVLPAISFVVLLGISYLMIRFQTTNLLAYMKEYYIKKNLQELHENMRDVMHSEKNVIFNLKILSQEALDSYGTEEGLKKLKKILDLSSNHIEALTQTISSTKNLKLKTINRSFFDAINLSLQDCAIPERIRIEKHFLSEQADCNYDLYHMSQVITNLLENAVDALSNTADPCITITVDVSYYWVYFSVADNGCGIPPDVINKIKKPYFSTKSRQNNWGVGLSYAFRVVKAHFGHMRVYSRPNEYTIFEILLTKGRKG